MKILYAIQGTGNGHISRAEDIIPILQKYGELDILISGSQSEVKLAVPITYQFSGLSFIFGKSGGIDLNRTFKKARLFRLLSDIFTLNVHEYDLIINDFEPVSAWACYLRGKKCISLSHQTAVINKNAPKPQKKDLLGILILKYYAPTSVQYSFHFHPYGPNIFTPVIRNTIRNLYPTKGKHYTVYLPAYSEEKLIHVLSELPAEWHVFSKHSRKEKQVGNVKISPVNNTKFTESLASCAGVLCGGGFEGPAEALFLQKKLMVIPMKGQYEQQCNAASLKQQGVPVLKSFNKKYRNEMLEFIETESFPFVNYPNQTAAIIAKLMQEQTEAAYTATPSLLGSL